MTWQVVSWGPGRKALALLGDTEAIWSPHVCSPASPGQGSGARDVRGGVLPRLPGTAGPGPSFPPGSSVPGSGAPWTRFFGPSAASSILRLGGNHLQKTLPLVASGTVRKPLTGVYAAGVFSAGITRPFRSHSAALWCWPRRWGSVVLVFCGGGRPPRASSSAAVCGAPLCAELCAGGHVTLRRVCLSRIPEVDSETEAQRVRNLPRSHSGTWKGWVHHLW